MGRKKVRGEDIARGVIKRAIRDASRTVREMVREGSKADDTLWKDVTVRQKASLILAGKFLDQERAKTEASGPKVFAPVFLVPQLKNAGQWEALAAEVEETGALPPVEEKRADEVIDVPSEPAEEKK